MFTNEELTQIAISADERAQRLNDKADECLVPSMRESIRQAAAGYQRLTAKALLIQTGVHSADEIEAILTVQSA